MLAALAELFVASTLMQILATMTYAGFLLGSLCKGKMVGVAEGEISGGGGKAE